MKQNLFNAADACAFLLFFFAAIQTENYAVAFVPFIFSFFAIVSSGFYSRFSAPVRFFFNGLGVFFVAIALIEIVISAYLRAVSIADFGLLFLMPCIAAIAFLKTKKFFAA